MKESLLHVYLLPLNAVLSGLKDQLFQSLSYMSRCSPWPVLWLLYHLVLFPLSPLKAQHHKRLSLCKLLPKKLPFYLLIVCGGTRACKCPHTEVHFSLSTCLQTLEFFICVHTC